jgi:NarL family two-component system response regulator LiaR
LIRLLIVDDHKMVRDGLKIFLSTDPQIEVVGEAADGKRAADLAKELKPDVILMDLIMPDTDGVEGTRLCLQVCPEAKVVVLTSLPDDEKVIPAMRAGALSYILKDISAEDLIKVIYQANEGQGVLYPIAGERLRKEMSFPSCQKESLIDKISPRELEVLRLIGQGFSNRQIAQKLFIGERTVKTHVGHLLEKLGLADRTNLAIYALTNNLVEASDSTGSN